MDRGQIAKQLCFGLSLSLPGQAKVSDRNGGQFRGKEIR